MVQSTRPEGSKFTIVCDEGPYLNGDDSAPSPLSYFCAGVAFGLLTQLSRSATMKQLDLIDARIELRGIFSIGGSFRNNSVQSHCERFEIDLDIESEESEQTIAQLLHMAHQSCYTEQTLKRPVPVETSHTLNGAPIDPSQVSSS